MTSGRGKVAIVTVHTPTLRWQRLDLMDEFRRRGWEVVALGNEPEAGWTEFFKGRGVRYRCFDVQRNGLNPVADMRTERELTTLLREEAPSKVFTYHAKANIYGCPAAARAGVLETYALVAGLGTIYNEDGLRNRLIRRVMSVEYRRALSYARRVFFQNHDDRDRLVCDRIVSEGKTVLINGSGVNLDRFARVPLPEGDSFLFVGRLVRGKGVMEYLEAARQVKACHPGTEFHLVGPYDSNPSSLRPEDLGPYLDDGTVAYHGEQSDVRPFLEACSCFVLPSYYGEGTPKSALEAMATGRPLIVADAVGCREVVRPGENGFLVPPRDPEAIAVAMERLISDRPLAQRMADASRGLAEEVFDVRRVNEAICETMGI